MVGSRDVVKEVRSSENDTGPVSGASVGQMYVTVVRWMGKTGVVIGVGKKVMVGLLASGLPEKIIMR